ncbi:MAG: TlpA disulfide reductase family protein [Chloroflexota bacterium]
MQDPSPNLLEQQTGPAPHRRMRPSRIAAAWAVGVIVILGIYLSMQPVGSLLGSEPSSRPDASASGQAGTGGPAPNFVTADGSDGLLGLDGRPIRLADFAGRPVWIVFWATWCIPCQEEASHIEAAYRAHEPDGLAVLAIDVQEPTTSVRKYVDAHGLSYAIGLDPTAAIMASYAARGLPSHVFVDRDGVIRDRYAGQLTAETMEQHLRAILGR